MSNQLPKRASREALPVLERNVLEYQLDTLSAPQKLYVQARSLGSLPVVAARIAGYKKPDTAAAELENDQKIRYALQMTARAKARERQITREVVLDWMVDAMRNAATSTEQLAAAREIGKMLGFYEPAKVQINATIEVRKQELMAKSDEELLAIAGDTLDGQFKLLDFEPEVSSGEDESSA